VSGHLVADEIAHMLADSEARGVVISPRRADEVRKALDALGGGPMLRYSAGPAEGFVDLAEATAGLSGEPLEDRTLGTTTFYTSGTTGRSKAVLREAPPGMPSRVPPEAFAAGAAFARTFGIGPSDDDVQLVSCPLYHAAPQGWAMFGLTFGHRLVVPAKWTAAGALAAIERHRVTYGFMVPTQFKRFLELPEDVRARADVSSLKMVVHAAAPCPPEIKRRIMEWWGPVVWEYYAGTEGFGTIVRPEEWLAKPGTVGRAWPGGDLKILDDDGNEVPPGEGGAIWLRSPGGENRFAYKGDPEKTAQAQRDGFFTLGDIGYVDEEGFLFLLDRRTDLIISGGVNIYPAEIEAVLASHPEVADVAVFGVPDEEWGQAVLAVVQPREGVAGDERLRAALLATCQEKLAKIKWPRRIEFRDTLPRQDNGKLYKRLLREEFAG